MTTGWTSSPGRSSRAPRTRIGPRRRRKCRCSTRLPDRGSRGRGTSTSASTIIAVPGRSSRPGSAARVARAACFRTEGGTYAFRARGGSGSLERSRGSRWSPCTPQSVARRADGERVRAPRWERTAAALWEDLASALTPARDEASPSRGRRASTPSDPRARPMLADAARKRQNAGGGAALARSRRERGYDHRSRRRDEQLFPCAAGMGGDGEGYAGRCEIDDAAELEGRPYARSSRHRERVGPWSGQIRSASPRMSSRSAHRGSSGDRARHRVDLKPARTSSRQPTTGSHGLLRNPAGRRGAERDSSRVRTWAVGVVRRPASPDTTASISTRLPRPPMKSRQSTPAVHTAGIPAHVIRNVPGDLPQLAPAEDAPMGFQLMPVELRLPHHRLPRRRLVRGVHGIESCASSATSLPL